MDEVIPIIIDNGTGNTQFERSSHDGPRTRFNVLGGPRGVAVVQTASQRPLVGDEAMDHRGSLNLKYPMEHGIITDWDAMTVVWNHALRYSLRIEPEEHPMLMLEAPLTPLAQRQRTTMIFFEEFNVPAFHLTPAPVAGLMATGRNSGIMLDIGDGVTSVTPIINGLMVTPGVRRMNFAGRDLSRYMARLLTESGVYLGNRSADVEHVRYMKQECCYVALDYDAELARASQSDDLVKEHNLPDEQVISCNLGGETLKFPYLDSERFRCPEALFQPNLVGLEAPGVHQLLYDGIVATKGDNVPICYSNMVLAGGCTRFAGFADRLHKEMTNLAPVTAKIRVVAPPERQYLSWIGGAIMSNLTNGVTWISKQEYEESGPGIVDVKCKYWM